MYIYNVTIKVSWQIQQAWLEWMKENHIPKVMATRCFSKNVFARLLEVDEEEGPSYTSQYYANTLADYEKYIDTFSNELRNEGINLWGNQFIAFRTIMQIVD